MLGKVGARPMLVWTVGFVSPTQAKYPVPTQGTTDVAQPADPTVALMNSQPIKASELDDYAAASKLPVIAASRHSRFPS